VGWRRWKGSTTSFRLSFHQGLLRPTGTHWLDDPPDASCKHSTRQHAVDGSLLSCKQQVGGSSPPASSQNGRAQAPGTSRRPGSGSGPASASSRFARPSRARPGSSRPATAFTCESCPRPGGPEAAELAAALALAGRPSALTARAGPTGTGRDGPQRRRATRMAATTTATSTAITTTTQIHSGPGIAPLLRLVAACGRIVPHRPSSGPSWPPVGEESRSLASQHHCRGGGPARPDPPQLPDGHHGIERSAGGDQPPQEPLHACRRRQGEGDAPGQDHQPATTSNGGSQRRRRPVWVTPISGCGGGPGPASRRRSPSR
jgi:hypothetical protein